MSFLLLPLSGWGQNDKSEETSTYGLKAGVNFAELWGADALPESDRKLGYSFGAYGSYKLNAHFKIQAELIWSLQGEDSEASGRYKISYLNIPLMLKGTEKDFYWEIGPQIGLLTISTAQSVPEELQLKDFETWDFSLNLGIGYNLDKDWSLGLRYSEGLSNIVAGRELRNSVIYIGIAYRLF